MTDASVHEVVLYGLVGPTLRFSVNDQIVDTTPTFFSVASSSYLAKLRFYDADSNLITYPNTFSNAAWISNQATVTSGFPDDVGELSGWFLKEDTSAANHQITQAITIAANTKQVVRVKAKANQRNKFELILSGGGFAICYFDVGALSGAVSGVSGYSVDDVFVNQLADGWVEAVAVITCTSTTAVTAIARLHNGTSDSYLGDGTSGLYIKDFKTGPLSRVERKITVESQNFYFGGVNVGPLDSVWAPPDPSDLRTMVFGDSYVEGAGGLFNALTGYANTLSKLMGWRDNWVSGVGGTGYLNNAATKLTFRQRVATDVIAYAPDVLIIAGGINDAAYSDAAIQAEAALLFAQISAALPNTLVFVNGPWDPIFATRASIGTAIQAAIGSLRNFYYVNNLGEAWQTGTGRVTAPVGDGNADIYTGSDGIHPTQAGHEYLANREATAISTRIASLP
jgi:lysophospholipase L1-like esterase